MSTLDPSSPRADPAQDPPLMSTKYGWWSVGSAGLSAVLLVLGGVVVFFFFGLNPDVRVASVVTGIVIGVVVVALTIAALIFGVASIVAAARHPGQPGRTTAIVLGIVGIVLGALMGFYLLLPLIP